MARSTTPREPMIGRTPGGPRRIGPWVCLPHAPPARLATPAPYAASEGPSNARRRWRHTQGGARRGPTKLGWVRKRQPTPTSRRQAPQRVTHGRGDAGGKRTSHPSDGAHCASYAKGTSAAWSQSKARGGPNSASMHGRLSSSCQIHCFAPKKS